MFSYSAEEWLLLFYIYCFLGWCFESAYVSLRTGHLVNRGFMKAPFLPLYGSGAILLLWVSKVFEGNILLTYVVGLIAATLLELFTGMIMEMIFQIKYWNYSNQRFNFKGHICLTSSIAWGFMTLLVTRVIHEPIASVLLIIPEIVKDVVALLLTAILIWDFAYSLREALDLRDQLKSLKEIWMEPGQHEGIEDKLEHIQAELTARYEVRIPFF
ncbi:MAG: putative ABC transporter permease [Lachnospiraceae bacterium]|nr:putative ABC transporter permease [Lachnospiraceae bacterium]MBR4060563.1 putative ABC transporter permease [Lachnospiraceae bacterium]